jgi:hypothetical protein
VLGQECPQQNADGDLSSEVRTLEGKLVFHDGMEQWFELELDPQECGQGGIACGCGRAIEARWRFYAAVESEPRAPSNSVIGTA